VAERERDEDAIGSGLSAGGVANGEAAALAAAVVAVVAAEAAAAGEAAITERRKANANGALFIAVAAVRLHQARAGTST